MAIGKQGKFDILSGLIMNPNAKMQISRPQIVVSWRLSSAIVKLGQHVHIYACSRDKQSGIALCIN